MQDERVASLIRQGQDAAQRGNPGLAREYLRAATELDPDNVTAWLWLSGVLDEPTAQRDALRRVLELDPTNVRAEQGLSALDARLGPAVAAPPAAPAPGPRGTSTLGPLTGSLSIEQELRATLRGDTPVQPSPTNPLALPAGSAVVQDSTVGGRRRITLFQGGDDFLYRVVVAVLSLLFVVGVGLFCYIALAG